MSAPRRPTKVKIKAPKRRGAEFQVDETWGALSKNLLEIFNHNAATLSFEENHRFAYNMVLYKHGEMLYNGVSKLIAGHLETLAENDIEPAFPSTAAHDPVTLSPANEALLKIATRIWEDHVGNVNKLSQILKYMDRVYVGNADVPDTWHMGLNLFLKHIIRPPIKDQLVTAILCQIKFDRDGLAISPATIKSSVAIFLSLDADSSGTAVYKIDLEPEIVTSTESYYRAEGQKLLDTCDAPEYLRRVEDRFTSEDNRTHLYLSPSTWPQLEQILKDHLLTEHLQAVISMENSGLETMLDLDKVQDLGRLYRLYNKVLDGPKVLNRALKTSIYQRGMQVNQTTSLESTPESQPVDGDDPKPKKTKTKPATLATQTVTTALKWVEDVLLLKDKFDNIWKLAFDGDREVESTINAAFESFVNQNKKSPEFISLFIDEHLKRGLKGKSDTEVDVILDKTITVFRFVAEKDMFEDYYKSHLAKRLLLGRSVSDDAERGMLAKLKVESGYQFTQKLEGMFHDMKISADHNTAFKRHLLNIDPLEVELSVTVMTSSVWPMQHSRSMCNFPECLMTPAKIYERFYLGQHSGRRLTWQPALGNADVRVQFEESRHDLNVSTFALVILLLFEDLKDDDFLEYEEIKTATAIEEKELQRQLQSLACAKYKVLQKHPAGKEVHTTDSFSFNTKFKCPLQKIKIQTVSSSTRVETGEERRQTVDNVEEQRRYQIEACIVRVMKDRKHMTHNNLVNEVTKQLGNRFKPDPLIIKRRIEDLIDREYLERCEDRRSYNYLA